MTTSNELERRLADFYATEAPRRAPDWILAATLATIETSEQRRPFIRAPWIIPPMKNVAKLVMAALVLLALVVAGLLVVGNTAPEPDSDLVPPLAEIVVTEANVPSSLTVYRTLRGVEALRSSGVVPADVLGYVDAIETSFDGDDNHVGDDEDLYRTFGAVYETVADAERAFDAAVAVHEADDWWGLTGRTPLERESDVGLGVESVHYTQGSDYGYPDISVYLWRVDNVLLHAVDFHPYDRSDLFDSIVRAMDVRASGEVQP